MSDPKRFDPLSDGMWENSAGDYVLYADYARLKAEVERLTEDNRQLTKVFEIAEGIIKRMGNAAENAAKEGKQS